LKAGELLTQLMLFVFLFSSTFEIGTVPAVLHLLDRFQKNEALSLKQQTVLEARLNELEKKLNDAKKNERKAINDALEMESILNDKNDHIQTIESKLQYSNVEKESLHKLMKT
jgi:hypothetical protein